MSERIQVAGGDTSTPINLKKRISLLLKCCPLSNPRFLDGGCGAGEYVAELARHGWDAHGIEYLDEKLTLAHKRMSEPWRVQKGDLQALIQADQSFDVVLLNEVLEHVPDDRLALQEVARVLRPGGHLFVFSPNRWYPFESHGVYLRGTQKRLPVWTPLIPWIPVNLGKNWFSYWARNYWPGQLRAMVRSAGFDVVSAGWVWQTFEGISGSQAAAIRVLKPILRAFSNLLEQTPGLRRFGVSQFIHARRRDFPRNMPKAI
jgi:SAM-dependent methyltransferase